MTTLVFDVNGTLTDPAAIGAVWERPELGEEILGRAVQTAIVAALLGTAERSFAEHIAAAIAAAVADHGLDADRIERAREMARGLPARPQAASALGLLGTRGARLLALTNSGREAGEQTLEHCGLLEHFDQVLGADAVGTFKPHPDVYAHAIAEAGGDPADMTLVATHPWDLAGGAHAGLRTAWVAYGARGWPEVYPAPDLVTADLLGLARALIG